MICLAFIIVYLLSYPFSTLHNLFSSTIMTKSYRYYDGQGESGENLPNNCFPIDISGRMGNIMFIYATAVGVCAFHKVGI